MKFEFFTLDLQDGRCLSYLHKIEQKSKIQILKAR